MDVEQTIVSQALKKFREANLVKTKRKGIFVYYDIFEEYPASIFVCIRKQFGYMSNQFYFLQDRYKAILPPDYTTMLANRIKLFANFDKMRILEYLLIHGQTSVSDIAKGIDCSALKVSQYLKRLKEDEFVCVHRNGRFMLYDIIKGVHKTALQCIHKRYQNLKNKADF